MIEAHPHPHFLPLCGGNTTSSDRLAVCGVSLGVAAESALCERQTGRKLNTSIGICNNQFVK